ncbi:protein kinase domain-containing protein [Smaragdicoccus niigatensis]|uniref:protein kinase domain-containing protein n=1 Tax=Smaragdicoccus niigatensis TaxID=359359 RepID=UPI00036572CF|nr:protein kinase [Smaragdicoccus niigatensis]
MDEIAFGRYRLRGSLGKGGMGEVFRAYDVNTDRYVALKLLAPHSADNEVFRERFRRESHAAASLVDPHVIPIYDYGEIDGRLFLAMALIDGTDVQTMLTYGPLAPDVAVDVIEQAASALDAAHVAGLIHRDVKPSNLLVSARRFVYLIDFGIARTIADTGLTSTGAAVGTFSYMAPERFTQAKSDRRVDIYALTCVLYECLTGAKPYPGASIEQQISGHISGVIPKPSDERPSLGTAFDAVIATGLAKDPDHRYQSAAALATAARSALATKATLPRPPSPHPPNDRRDGLVGPRGLLRALVKRTPATRKLVESGTETTHSSPSSPLPDEHVAPFVAVDPAVMKRDRLPPLPGPAGGVRQPPRPTTMPVGPETIITDHGGRRPAGSGAVTAAVGALSLTARRHRRWFWLVYGAAIVVAVAAIATTTTFLRSDVSSTQPRIATGVDYSLALTSSGDVIVWGGNRGLGAFPDPPSNTKYTAISAGDAQAVAVTVAGNAVVWDRSGVREQPPPGGHVYTAVAMGRNAWLALTDAGTIDAFGGLTRVPAPANGQRYTAIAAGASHVMALTSAGQVLVWGNANAELTTVPDPPPGQRYTAIAAGDSFSLALTTAGQIVAWGRNAHEQTTVPALPGGQRYIAVAAGYGNALGLTSAGSIIAWGDQSYALANGRHAPTGQIFTELAAGRSHALALTNDGRVIAWGSDLDNQTNVPDSLR